MQVEQEVKFGRHAPRIRRLKRPKIRPALEPVIEEKPINAEPIDPEPVKAILVEPIETEPVKPVLICPIPVEKEDEPQVLQRLYP